MARNRYSGSIKPPSACTLEFLRFGVSDVSLTLSQFRGGNIRHAWLTARENSSLIYLIDPTYIYIYIYTGRKRRESWTVLPFFPFSSIEFHFSKPLFTFDSTSLVARFPWQIWTWNTYLRVLPQCRGTCTLVVNVSTGSRAGCAGIPEVISKAARRGFSRSRMVTIWTFSPSLALSRSFSLSHSLSLSLSLHEMDGS